MNDELALAIAGNIVARWVARDDIFNTNKTADLVIELAKKIKERCENDKKTQNVDNRR